MTMNDNNSVRAIKKKSAQTALQKQQTINRIFLAMCVLLVLAGIVCFVASIVIDHPEVIHTRSIRGGRTSDVIISPPLGIYILGSVLMLATGIIGIITGRHNYKAPQLAILGACCLLPCLVIIVNIIGDGMNFISVLDFRLFLLNLLATAAFLALAIFRNRLMPKKNVDNTTLDY